MTNREQIEQAIISAGAYNGNDTVTLLSEVSKVYEKADAWDKLKNDTLAEYELYNASLKKIEDKEVGLATLTRLTHTRYFLLHMDKLDGTNDFEQFLEGLERGE